MKIVRLFWALGVMLCIFELTVKAAPAEGRLAHTKGELASVGRDELTISLLQASGERKNITMATDDRTKVLVDGEAVMLDDLSEGMLVQVSYILRPGVPTLVKQVTATSKSISGLVLKVDAGSLQISKNHQKTGEKKELVVETNSRTKVLFTSEPGGKTLPEPRQGSLEEIKEGYLVKVLPDTGIARRIYVTPMQKRGK